MSAKILAVSAVDGSNNFTIQFSSAATHTDGSSEPITVSDESGSNVNTAVYASGDGTDTLHYHVDGGAASYVTFSINDSSAWSFASGGSLVGVTAGPLPYAAQPDMLQRSLSDGESFDSGVVNVGAAWTPIGAIDCASFDHRCAIQLDVAGGGPLTHLKIMRSVKRGGPSLDLCVDGDFATATAEVQNVIPAGPDTASAGTTIQIVLNCDGIAEYSIWAKSSADATLRMTGRLPRKYS